MLKTHKNMLYHQAMKIKKTLVEDITKERQQTMSIPISEKTEDHLRLSAKENIAYPRRPLRLVQFK